MEDGIYNENHESMILPESNSFSFKHHVEVWIISWSPNTKELTGKDAINGEEV